VNERILLPSLLTLAVLGGAASACTRTEVITRDVAGDGGKPGPDGTSNGGGAGAGTTSGTRLRARTLVAEDGARAPNGWHDSARGVDCSFQRAADGKLRCLPLSSGTIHTQWFADASCTKPLAYVSKGCDAPTTAARTGAYCGGSGGSGTTLYDVSGRFNGTTVYTKTTNGCSGSPVASYAESYDFFSIGAEIDASEFVAAEESVE